MPSANDDRVVLIHGHIFKNAGTTFDWSLERSFGDGFLDHRDDKAMRHGGAGHIEQLLIENSTLRAISSHHMIYPLPDIAGVRFCPVYLFRHPLDRVASVYNFERQQEAETPGAKMAKELSFRDYVRWRMRDDVAATIRDYQCLNFSGGSRGLEPVQRFAMAMDRLDALSTVGVVDRYDESMVVLEQQLSLEGVANLDLAYLAQNVTLRRSLKKRKNLEERVKNVERDLGSDLESVLARNGFDQALYARANEKLDAAIADIPDFAVRLDRFRQRCGLLKS